MKTRYTPLVSVKKNIMQKSERVLQNVNGTLNKASMALSSANDSLNEIKTPKLGIMPKFLASRMLLDAQREVIAHNEKWVDFAKREVNLAKEQLKLDTIEYEKFNYLDLQDIKEQLKKVKFLEAKELDEIALITYNKKRKAKEAF